MRAAWPDVLTRLAADSRVAWTAFHSATPLSLSAGVLAVAVSEPGHVRAIAQRGHDERLRQSLIDVLGLDVTIDVVHDPDPARGPDLARASSSDSASPAAAAGRIDGADEWQPPAAHARDRRGADLVRAAGSERAPDEPADEPSADDPDLAPGVDGLALITEQLGARPIGEIDHS